MTIRIDCKDCVEWVKDESNHGAQMAFADNPFNIGQKYNGFRDCRTEADLSSFTNLWMTGLWECVQPGGVMLIYHPVLMQRFIWSTLNLYEMSQYHANTIIANYNFGQHRWTEFVDAHCQCVVLRKPGGDRMFNAEEVLVPSERLKMGDKRVLNSPHKGMKTPGNVMPVEIRPDEGLALGKAIKSPRVQGNNNERWCISKGALVDHPNQLPVSFLERLVAAYTKEGDFVVEPFTGSGSLAVTCQRMGRDYAGCDISQETVDSAAKRLGRGF